MKEQLTLKKGIENLLLTITFICIGLVATTADSELSLDYLLFFLVNIAIISFNSMVLAKYGKSFR